MDAMIKRGCSGQHSTVGRQGKGDRCDGIFEQHSFSGQCIDIGCGPVGIAVTTKDIGSGGVHTDKYNMFDPPGA